MVVLAMHVARVFVVADPGRMPQESVARPLDKRDFYDDRWLHRPKSRHVLLRDALTPMAAPVAVRQVDEWAARRREPTEAPKDFSSYVRRQARTDLSAKYKSFTTQEATSVAFTRALRALGLTGVSHHTFRHTGATVMVANGVSLRAVQTIGGWSTLRMVERYAHVDDAELARAVRVTHNHTEDAAAGAQKRAQPLPPRAETRMRKLMLSRRF